MGNSERLDIEQLTIEFKYLYSISAALNKVSTFPFKISDHTENLRFEVSIFAGYS